MSVEPTNVPCGGCGAPMREDDSSHLAGSVTMRCEFCGASEALPADAEHRVLALRTLRVQRRWAKDAARGPALAYLRLMESSALFVAPYAFAALVMVGSLANTGAALVPIGVVGGIGIASYIALRLSRTRLRATLVPVLRALPGEPGRPQRCRRCGGELPASASAFVDCGYCSAPNLVSAVVAAANHAALRVQTDDARAYGAETAAAIAAAGQFTARAIQIAFFAGAIAGGALGLALQSGRILAGIGC